MRAKLENLYHQLIALCSKWQYILIMLIIYKSVLDLIYVKYLVGDFGYSKVLNPFNLISGYLFMIVLLGSFVYLYKRESSSNIIIIILSLIYFIPMTTYCGLGGGSSALLFGAIVFFLIFFAFQFIIPYYSVDISEVKYPKT